MKKDIREKISIVVYLLISLFFYGSAILCFINEPRNIAAGIINIGFGTAFLCLPSLTIKQEKNNKDDK